MTSRRSMRGLLAALAGLLAQSAASATGPDAVVQAQLAAYNARDLTAFLATYAEDAQLFEHPSELLASGGQDCASAARRGSRSQTFMPRNV